MASVPEHTSADTTATAARWVARRDAGLNAAERRQLGEWLAADPSHAAAFSRADGARTELDWPLHSGSIDTILPGLESRARQRRRRRRSLARAGALGALALLALGGWWRAGVDLPDLPTPAAPAPTLLVSEPQRRTLPDGSVMDLKEGARLTTRFDATARRITLTRGTVHFQVIKDSRPFIVQAEGVTAEALGTAFVVEVGAQEVSVLVTEGQVAVARIAETSPVAAREQPSPPAPLAVLKAGRLVSVPIVPDARLPAVAVVPASELEARLDWRTPRLEFNGTPLVEVVAKINRYNQRQFVIADPVLEQLALSGILRADKIEALVAMLEADFPIAAERRGGEIVLRSIR